MRHSLVLKQYANGRTCRTWRGRTRAADTKQEVEKLRSELEALYDQKVEGIIVRSRARWHEHDEKNRKYFLI